MGQCNSTAAGSSAVDPALANCKSHLYAEHLEVDKKKKHDGGSSGPLTRDVQVRAVTTADPLEMFSYDGALRTANGQRFYLKGINWFGFEGANKCAQGLWAQPLSFYLDFLAANGFNALRLPLNAQFCLSLDDTNSLPSGFDTAKNPSLAGKTYGGVLDIFMQQCAARGIWVLLDMHVLTVSGGVSDPLWYNNTISEAQWIQAWLNLVNRYKNRWNLLGCDLKNELHGAAAWRSGNQRYDWDAAAVRCGNQILAVNPKLLIFVEGTSGNNFPVETQANLQGYWWGGDLSSVARAPIQFNVPNKLVYSPHCYGPTVYVQPYFNATNFPSNMPPIWTSHFGHILANKPLLGPALVLGEWGGQNVDGGGRADATWHAAFVPYLKQLGATDTFYWCLNPTSSDTGGLLQSDWATPVQAKMSLLANLVSQPGRVVITAGAPSAISPGGGQAAYSLSGGAATTPPTTTPPTNPPTTSQITLKTEVVNTWRDGSGTLLSQINYTLQNSGAAAKSCSLGLAQPGLISQIWNLTQTAATSNGYTVFALPAWAQQSGGVPANGSFSFGGIFRVGGGSPSWVVLG